MDNIKQVFKNIKLDDEIFYGDWRCAERPDEKGDFVSRISERSIARAIMDYSKATLWANERIKAWTDNKLIELSPDYDYELVIDGVKVLRAVVSDWNEYSVDIEINFKVIG